MQKQTAELKLCRFIRFPLLHFDCEENDENLLLKVYRMRTVELWTILLLPFANHLAHVLWRGKLFPGLNKAMNAEAKHLLRSSIYSSRWSPVGRYCGWKWNSYIAAVHKKRKDPWRLAAQYISCSLSDELYHHAQNTAAIHHHSF